MLDRLIKRGRASTNLDELTALGDHCSKTERRAETAERELVKHKLLVYMSERLGTDRWRTTMRYTITNARPNAVTVDLMQSGLWGDTRITSESMPSERRSADDALWRVPVPANGEAVVTATFDTRY